MKLFGEQENAAEVERRIGELKAPIEAEQKANTNPPTDLMNGKSEAAPSEPSAPPTTTAPQPTTPATATATATALVASAPPRPERKPLAKRGWSWGVIVGGAVVVGGAVALGVVLGAKHQDPVATLGSVGAN